MELALAGCPRGLPKTVLVVEFRSPLSVPMTGLRRRALGVQNVPSIIVRRALRGMKAVQRHTDRLLFLGCALLAVVGGVGLGPGERSSSALGNGAARSATARETPAASDVAVPSIVDLAFAPTRSTAPQTSVPAWWRRLADTAVISYFSGPNGPDPLAQSPIDVAQVDADFARIASLHANTVRMIVSTSMPPGPDARYRIGTFLRLAARHGLRTQMTLFNGYSGYDVAWSRAWLAGILAPFARDSRIAFLELQNEIDPGNPRAMAWARTMLPNLRTLGGGIPVTLSVGGWCMTAARLAALKKQLGSVRPDFWDAHYYCSPAAAYTLFRRTAEVASPLPLLIGETGYSTVVGDPKQQASVQGTAWQEAEQAMFYRVVQDAARDAGLPPAGVWLDSDVSAAREPKSPPSELHFGLYRLDGTPKPAAAVVAAAFQRRSLGGDVLNGGFELDEGGYPAYWMETAAAYGTFRHDSTVSHSGHASVSISDSSSGTPSGEAPAWSLAVPRLVVAGRRYTASAWVRGADVDGSVMVGLAWYDGAGNGIQFSASSLLPNRTTGWKLLFASSIAPSKAVYAEIFLISRANRGTAWFDDVSYS